jgi:hypothetical protein
VLQRCIDHAVDTQKVNTHSGTGGSDSHLLRHVCRHNWSRW